MALIMSSLELITERLNEAEARMDLVLSTVDIGVWEWNVCTNTLTWDTNMYKMFGVLSTGTAVDYSFFEKCLVPP